MPDVDVLCFPTDDLSFERVVRELAHRYDDATLEHVETQLRLAYPLACLRLKDAAAELFPNERTAWYAFRDGHGLL